MQKPTILIFISNRSVERQFCYLVLTMPVTSERPVLDISPSLKSRYSIAVAQFSGVVAVSLMKKLRK